MNCKYAEGQEIVMCTLLWECSCETNYIHGNYVTSCKSCGCIQEEHPQARCVEAVEYNACPEKTKQLFKYNGYHTQTGELFFHQLGEIGCYDYDEKFDPIIL